MSFEPIDEILSFWHAWQRWCGLKKNGNQERREQEEIEEDPAEEIDEK